MGVRENEPAVFYLGLYEANDVRRELVMGLEDVHGWLGLVAYLAFRIVLVRMELSDSIWFWGLIV